MDEKKLEARLSGLPICQYAFIDTAELVFTERVRYICRTECPMYGKSWACPPAVGTVEECKERVMAYPRALIFTTITEVEDISDLACTLATRRPHEEITRKAAAAVKEQTDDILVLSSEACEICESCAWPDGPCRNPQSMYPCVESHGILITETAEKLGIEFINGNLVTWFSLIMYR